MKPRLCHIFPVFATGGPEVRMTILINELSGDFQHTVVSLSGELSGAARVLSNTGAEFQVGPPAGRTGRVASLAKLIRKLAPDLLLTYGWGGIDALLAGRLLGYNQIIHTEDGFLPDESVKQRPKRLLARRVILRAARKLVCPSQTLVDIAKNLWWLDPRRIQFVPNGVDTRRFVPGKSLSVRARMGVQPDDLVVATLGHLRTEKNHGRMIRAFAKASQGMQAKLLIIGEGALRESIGRLVVELSVADRVFFPGLIKDPADCYHAMDLFAMSSDTEQMPIAVLEAMSAGLPIVSTAAGDTTKMVAESNRPYVTTIGEEAAYETAFRRLLEDAKLREKLGADNRMHVQDNFSLKKMVDRYGHLYESMLPVRKKTLLAASL